MVITKEMLQARAAELQKEAERLRAELNATIGAVQDCGFWLAQLEKAETPQK